MKGASNSLRVLAWALSLIWLVGVVLLFLSGGVNPYKIIAPVCVVAGYVGGAIVAFLLIEELGLESAPWVISALFLTPFVLPVLALKGRDGVTV